MANIEIPNVDSHKHLGCILSSNGNWHRHIDYIKNKAWQRIHVMKKLKFTLNRKSLEIIYVSFIRPILEYANVVWDNCTNSEKDDIDKIQNEAARIVVGCNKLIAIENLYNEVGWETLNERRRKHKLLMF